MEFCRDTRRIAFTTKPNGTVGCDTWEEDSLVRLPFKYTASFMTEVDARIYLAAKYPDAVEKRSNTGENVAANVILIRPRRPHDQRDDEAWRNRDDSIA
jgi:hypothetical protein